MENNDSFTICEGRTCNEIVFVNATRDDIAELHNLTGIIELHETDDVLKHPVLRSIIVFIYCVVILLGCFENSIVLYVFIKNKYNIMRVTCNVFIIGLAVSDILLCVFNLPLQLHYQLTDQWIFGETLCRVFMPTYAVPVFVSSMCILVIAIDRYRRIVHPLHQHISMPTAISVLISIAFCTSVISIPVVINTKYDIIDFSEFNFHRAYCFEIWSSVELRHVYTSITIALQFFIPLLATSYLYMKILNVRRRRLSMRRNEQLNRNKTNRILIAVVLLFSICWLPWNVFALTLEFKPLLIPARYIKLCDLSLKIFAMSSACVNPFLYSWLNKNFRRGFRRVLMRESMSEKSRLTKMSNELTTSPL